jgi:hypothetical protein
MITVEPNVGKWCAARQFAKNARGRLDFMVRGDVIASFRPEPGSPSEQAVASLVKMAVAGDLWATDYLKSTLHADPNEREAAAARIKLMHHGKLPKHTKDIA